MRSLKDLQFSLRARTLLALAVALSCLLALSTSAQAVKAPPEAYSALQKQAAAGQVAKATITPKTHVAKIKLKNGKKYDVTFPAADQTTLVASLKSHHAKVHVSKTRKVKSGSHPLRLIAIIVLVLAAIGGAVALVMRARRGPQAPEAGAAASPPAEQAPPPS